MIETDEYSPDKERILSAKIETDFESALRKAGGFGRYQAFLFAFLSLTGITVAFHNLIHVFTGELPTYSCDLEFGPASPGPTSYYLDDIILNTTYSKHLINDTGYINHLNISYPSGILTEQMYYIETCGIINNASFLVWRNISSGNTRENTSVIPCTKWKFDQSVYLNTVGTEWSLVCQKQWLLPFVQSLHMVGCLIGSLTGGLIADRFGRRPTVIMSVILELLAGVATAFSPNFIVYAFLRLLVGVAIASLFNAVLITAVEIVSPSWRLLVSSGLLYMNAVGTMILALIAYFIRSWRTLQLIIASILSIQLIYIWLVPESPRWLLVKGRIHQATSTIKNISRHNKKTWPDDMILTRSKQSESGKTPCILDIFRTPKIRSRTLKISFVWLVVSVVYYGLSLYTSQLDGDNFINFLLSGVVEIPALTFAILGGKRLGRRILLGGPLALAGACLILTSPVPDDLAWIRVALAMAGKLGMTTAFATIYPFTVEMFPTSVRSNGLGFCSMCARVGGLISPFIVVLNTYGRLVPMLVCGGLAFTASLLVCFLPETANLALAETVDDTENQKTVEGVCSLHCLLCCKNDIHTRRSPMGQQHTTSNFSEDILPLKQAANQQQAMDTSYPRDKQSDTHKMHLLGQSTNTNDSEI